MDGGRQIGSWTMVALRGGEGLWRGIYAPAIVLLVLLVLLVDGHICLLGIREPSNVPGIRRQRGVDEKAYNVYNAYNVLTKWLRRG